MQRVNLTLDKETLQKARENANKMKISLSAYIRLLINSK